ncbi:hypothetical protein RLOC_00012161 [Lonchura striata]|uniref:Uncharacterized protein n=1 Tax=Lonchura striata TaxID=40157 RepID=A0A218V3X8_9PASE|nr:hypothetical protein RLOC_00012161 [Lonchura striata domestica]
MDQVVPGTCASLRHKGYCHPARSGMGMLIHSQGCSSESYMNPTCNRSHMQVWVGWCVGFVCTSALQCISAAQLSDTEY